jgi:flagellar basal-body rod protein FlgC
MGIPNLFEALRISASGLTAEQLRMDVIANNIANATATRGPGGLPYRRQQVVFESMLRAARRGGVRGEERLGGVRAADIVRDPSPFQQVYDPSHPDADTRGYVRMPNVQLPLEMVDLITAARAFEANAKAIAMYRRLMERVLTLGR